MAVGLSLCGTYGGTRKYTVSVGKPLEDVSMNRIALQWILKQMACMETRLTWLSIGTTGRAIPHALP
jgi:hypothetical protein